MKLKTSLKKLSLSAAATVTALALVIGGASAASAVSYTKYPKEGGTWKHGTDPYAGTQWDAWSDYYHGSKQHAAIA